MCSKGREATTVWFSRGDGREGDELRGEASWRLASDVRQRGDKMRMSGVVDEEAVLCVEIMDPIPTHLSD